MRLGVFILMLIFSGPCYGQENPLATARAFLAESNYEKARPIINEAIRNPNTSSNPEAWFLRGLTYLMIATDNISRNKDAAAEAYASFSTALTLKPDYGAEINYPLYGIAIIKFNTAVEMYSANDYKSAYREFMIVNDIYRKWKMDRFADNTEFAALSVDARKNAAYSAINAGNDNDARPILEELVKAEAKDDIGIYQSLIEIYDAAGKRAQQIAMIKTALLQFPGNAIFQSMEADYKAKTAKKEKAAPKKKG